MPEAGGDARKLLDEIRAAAIRAHSEEDFKIGAEAALAHYRKQYGIEPRYETSYPAAVSVLGGGSSDAVYGHLIIEYKKPGRLGTPLGLREATGELKKYMFAEASRYGDQSDDAVRRIVGVGLDGKQILFLRYRGPRRTVAEASAIPAEQLTLFQLDRDTEPGFQLVGPTAITEESLDLLLVYLRALRRRALTPEALASDFGPDGPIARRLVSRFAGQLTSATASPDAPPRITTLFREWDRTFGIVYGQELAAASERAAVLAKLYGVDGSAGLKELLFSVHTYYALLMKLLAAELASLQQGSMVASPLAGLPTMNDQQLLIRLRDLEDGGLFSRLEIRNFLEGDFFSWYLDAFDSEVGDAVRELAQTLTGYEPATGSLRPEATRDLLKKLYQYLIPPELRHDLGEYYTPDWLAELTLDEAGYHGDLEHRLLDPACGSGTFLVFAIRRAREWADDNVLPPEETVERILASIVGFDLNPLAVIAARTNYLLALGTLMRRAGAIEIPVYLADSILTPALQGEGGQEQQQALFLDYELPSTVGTFSIPRVIVSAGALSEFTAALEDAVRKNHSEEVFLTRVRELLPDLTDAATASIRALFAKLGYLEARKEDGLWARLIKNGFAPIFAGKFEFVIGNPPWIRWGYLSTDYRAATLEMWSRYGLFALRGGMEARLGGGEKDFSMLFLYACADYYLRDGGTLAFLITQEVVKGKGAGKGFRRFRIGANGAPMKVHRAHDLVRVQPFERAANKTAMLVLTKGEVTTYPIPYTVWTRKKGIGTIPTDATLAEARTLTNVQLQEARPIGADPTASWQTTNAAESARLAPLRGRSEYAARRGAGTDPYGVFWLQVLDVRADGMLVVRNRHELGKTDVPEINPAIIEPDLVYPAVRGADIDRWVANPRIHVLVAQDPETRAPYPATELLKRWPRTFKYLWEFRDVLSRRKSKTVRDLMARTEPWAMFGIGPYTFAPYRVTWKRMADDMVAAVVSDYHTPFGLKRVVSTDTTAFIPVPDQDEAHYLAGLLNSTPVRDYIRSYSSAGRGFGAPSVIEHIGIPAFDGANAVHLELSRLAKLLSAALTEADRDKLTEDLDSRAAEVFVAEP